MPMPAAWVDHLFAKLTIRYGDAFMRQWRDANPALVKSDWAEVLDGISGPTLQYAIANLTNTPPNAMQFRDLCRTAPGPNVYALPRPAHDPTLDPARIDAALRKMDGVRLQNESTSAAQQCINNIERIVENRAGKISSAQKHMISHCLTMPGTSTKLAIKRVA
jgi:hypothetical protein